LARCIGDSFNPAVRALPFILTAGLSYLLGSIPTGWIVAKAHGVNIQSVGSGNIGATNVLRTLGTSWGLLVLVLDFFKGLGGCLWMPSLAAMWCDVPADAPERHFLPMIGGLCAILGHNFTFWLRFKGGKGIATSAGVLAGLMPWGLLIALLSWLVVFGLTRYVSLGSMAAAAALPIGVYFTGGSRTLLGVALAMSLLATWKHRGNIQRLIAGTEPRVGRLRPDPAQPHPRTP
jgi:glycerol-3-phosphate acyltransferase PlsY